MSQFQEEMKVIPRTAWAIAVAFYAGFVALVLLVLIPRDENLAPWPAVGRTAFAIGIPLFLAIYILLIGYVNGDARRRGMRYVMWTLLATFIPNAIGIILYFILRDPLLTRCRCGSFVRSGFAFCTACGAPLTRTCPECRQAVKPSWAHCPACGKGLHGA